MYTTRYHLIMGTTQQVHFFWSGKVAPTYCEKAGDLTAPVCEIHTLAFGDIPKLLEVVNRYDAVAVETLQDGYVCYCAEYLFANTLRMSTDEQNSIWLRFSKDGHRILLPEDKEVQ